MSFNPAFVAFVAANNARMSAMYAQEEAEEAEARLAELERRMEIERREHQWSLELVQLGWSKRNARNEATKETRRQEIYPRLRADLDRMLSRKPRAGTSLEYDGDITQRKSRIESRRASRKFGPHPLALGASAILLIALAAWIVVSAAGIRTPVSVVVISAASLLAILPAYFIWSRSQGMWMRYRTRAIAKADARAIEELFELPHFKTWRYEKFDRESKPYWAAQGYAFHDRDSLKNLGSSPIDERSYEVLIKRADRMLQGHWETEVDYLFEAIEECIDSGQLNRANSLISTLGADGQSAFRDLIRETGAVQGVPLDDSNRFVSSSESGSKSQKAKPVSTLPSKVQGLGAYFDGKVLCVTWNPPAQNADAVSSYLVHVKQKGTQDEWTFEVVETEARVDLMVLVSEQDYSVCVQVMSNGKRCERGKAILVRSGSTTSWTTNTNPKHASQAFCTKCGQPRAAGKAFCTQCGAQHA